MGGHNIHGSNREGVLLIIRFIYFAHMIYAA